MSEDFIVHAKSRTEQGTSASRRLRRTGMVPGIVYGGEGEPVRIAIDHNEVLRHLEHEAFFSHILKVEIDGKSEDAVLKDLQRHPAKLQILHIDFMRVVAGQVFRMTVPIHFTGEEAAPGVKNDGGVLDRMRTELEIECLPKNLPEYIEVDVSAMNVGDVIHVRELTLPEGVTSVAEIHDEDYTICSLHIPRVVVEEEPEADDEDAVEGDEDTAEGEDAEGGDESESDED